MAPYAVAHLKLGMQLQETGYKFASDQRLGIYLTNTLEEAAKQAERLYAGWFAEEANAAAKLNATSRSWLLPAIRHILPRCARVPGLCR